MLSTIEPVTKQKIIVEKLPTLSDLRTRRLELTRAALREILLTDDMDHFRLIVESLADEFDVMNVALAAVKLAHEATAGDNDDEIPEVKAPPASGRRRKDDEPRGTRSRRSPAGEMTRVFIGAGRIAGMRPQDLVGAIAGGSALSGRDIGAIEIADRFSLVEIPESSVDDVITALRATRIKGKKPTIRRERDNQR
jgi:ATP-dependent RNA helicase DeaD